MGAEDHVRVGGGYHQMCNAQAGSLPLGKLSGDCCGGIAGLASTFCYFPLQSLVPVEVLG